MITVVSIGVLIAIFNSIQALHVRPVFIKVKANNSKRNFK